MSGFFFAALTAVFFGLQSSYSKYAAKDLSYLALTTATICSALPVLLAYLFYSGIPDVDVQPFLLATCTSYAFNLFAFPLFFRAIVMSPLYLTMPFTAFTPLFLIPIAWLTLGELPDRSGLAGILMIIGGVYVIYLRGDWLSPFRSLLNEPGSRYMLLVAVLWSVSGTVEKSAVLASSAAFYGTVVHIMLAISFIVYMAFKQPKELTKIRLHPRTLIVLSLISGSLVICQLTALTLLQVSYVLSFKRGGILISIFLGYLFFKEPNPVKNLAGGAIIVAGAVLLMI